MPRVLNRVQLSIMVQIIWALLLSTVVMLLIASLLRSEGLIDKIINRNLAVGFLMQALLLVAPSLIQYVLPLTTAFSVIFVYAKLGGSNELVVMGASGMSNLAIARPALLVSLGSAVICFLVSVYLTPSSFAAFKDLERYIQSDLAAVSIRAGRFNRFGSGITVYVRDIAPDGQMRGVLLRDSRKAQTVFLIADRASMVASSSGVSVVLADGNRQESGDRPEELSVVYFDRYEFELPREDVFRVGAHDRGIAERELGDLLTPSDNDRADPRILPRMLTEGYQRIVTPLVACTYTLLGLVALLSGSFQRRGPALRVTLTVGGIAGLQVLHMTLINLASGDAGMIPSIFLVPIAGTVVLGALLLAFDRSTLLARLARRRRPALATP